MRKSYPSDISRKQFETIQPLLESVRKTTKPRTVDLYEILCAIFYVLKTGSQWRMLPHDLKAWQTVYSYFRIRMHKLAADQPSCLEVILRQLVEEHRVDDGRTQLTSFIIVDSQSVPNADTAAEKGYDGGKKISGIKRHVAVDINGLPHAIHVTTANVGDREGAMQAFQISKPFLSAVINVLADSAYDGKPFEKAVEELIDASVEIAKRSELHIFKVIPKRWVVERSFGWLDFCRRLWKNCERLLETSRQLVVLAFLSVLLRRT
jgi:transposase